jgi:hypothetical protein
VPAVVRQTLPSTEKIGATVLHAQGLIRSAMVGTLDETVNAAMSTRSAVQTGTGRIHTALFGASNAQCTRVGSFNQSGHNMGSSPTTWSRSAPSPRDQTPFSASPLKGRIRASEPARRV